MDDFLNGLAKGTAVVGGYLAQGLAGLSDAAYSSIDRAVKNGDYEKLARLTPEQLEAYMKYNPEAAASLKAAGKRWVKWGRGERD